MKRYNEKLEEKVVCSCPEAIGRGTHIICGRPDKDTFYNWGIWQQIKRIVWCYVQLK